MSWCGAAYLLTGPQEAKKGVDQTAGFCFIRALQLPRAYAWLQSRVQPFAEVTFPSGTGLSVCFVTSFSPPGDREHPAGPGLAVAVAGHGQGPAILRVSPDIPAAGIRAPPRCPLLAPAEAAELPSPEPRRKALPDELLGTKLKPLPPAALQTRKGRAILQQDRAQPFRNTVKPRWAPNRFPFSYNPGNKHI